MGKSNWSTCPVGGMRVMGQLEAPARSALTLHSKEQYRAAPQLSHRCTAPPSLPRSWKQEQQAPCAAIEH